jgi:type IV secretory pathway TraG/TraD family ATPase VirD4
MFNLPIGIKAASGHVFSILGEDRRKHMAIFGKSGVGKTTLLRNMIAHDIGSGLGVTVIDPHGSLIQDVLEAIPRSRTNDVIYFNPKDANRVLGINLLDSVLLEERPLVVSALISILRNVWVTAWGPRTEYILSHAALALLEQYQPVSLLALSKLLTNSFYRRQVLRSVTDPVVLSFFKIFENWNDRFREEAIAPLLNKVSKFVTNPLLRSVIGQTSSSFDFRWLMDQRKILLCDLSKGALGEDVSSVLGSLVVTKLALAALSRQNVTEAERVPHILYGDEIQAFIHGVDFPTVLAEARKYKLVLVVATQTLNQLPKESLNAVFGNCATVMSFRVGGNDAQMLAREFGMVLPASELQDLPDYKIWLATLVEGRPSGPHLVHSFPPLAGGGLQASPDVVIETSLARYGRPRKEIEARLNRFLSLTRSSHQQSTRYRGSK